MQQIESNIWDGKIMFSKRNLRLINFRLEPELIKQLDHFNNKSAFIRQAIKEKLDTIRPKY